tara:strand:+ start:4580 stop:5731 length:1152 start_codon:yes stop_codon:yes gene_type:complete
VSEIKVNSIKGVGASTAAISIDNSSGTCTANITSVNGGQLGGRNLLINGDMRINQRHGTAAMEATNANPYSLDRWVTANDNATSRFTVQQVVDAPVGFYYSLKATSQYAYTPASGEVFGFGQKIEGYNTNWLEFGTANAKSITISFFVKSSLTGTFGGSVLNNDMTRGFPFTYTISSANTWEKKTVTVAGSTDGTWNTTNGTGIRVHWSMGANANRSDTAGQWSSTQYTFHPTGATNVVANNGATLQVTGCQVEEGTTATLYEHRPYAQELSLAQRYFEKSFKQGTAPAQNVSAGVGYYLLHSQGSQLRSINIYFKVTKRTDPTMTYFNPYAANANARLPFSSTDLAGIATNTLSDNWFSFDSTDNTPSPTLAHLMWTANAEL